ncbi:MAG TPA: ATP synthase subunit I [Casimicrobiaceae bacterium]|nr:ATP synthase subunit I [Casimicrobiaceae bacterium]
MFHPASIPAPRYPAGQIALWQLLASGAAAGAGGWWAGWHGALSAILGGVVNISAGVVFALLVRLGRSGTAAATVRTMIRAEAAKIAVIVLQLWLVLTSYRDIVHGAFIAAFVLTVLVAQAAILIRD